MTENLLARSESAVLWADILPALARTCGVTVVDASIAAEHHLIRGDE